MGGATRGADIAYAYINLDDRRWRRLFIEIQVAAHGIAADRVPAMTGQTGRGVLPACTLEGGELGLMSTWYELVRTAASRRRCEWLVVIEDDALLQRSARLQIERTLESSDPEVVYVQLGFLTDGSWRVGKPIKVNVVRKMRALRRALSLRGRGTGLVMGDLLDGTHLHAVRLNGVDSVLAEARTTSLPLDQFLRACSHASPHSYARPARSIASQFPFRSDILTSRRLRRI